MFKRLRQNNRATTLQIVVVWVVGVGFSSFLWLVFSWPTIGVIEAFESTTGFPDQALATINFLKVFFVALPILIAIFYTVWAFNRANSPQWRSEPYGY